MITIELGDEFEHDEHGTVVVQNIQESLDKAYFDMVDDEPVFEGGQVDESYVRFYAKSVGLEGQEEIMEFCEKVGVFDNN